MTYAEFGSFEAYYNDPAKPDGLYRCGDKIGSVMFLEAHWFVVAEYVGTSTESLELALQQYSEIRRVLSKPDDSC